MLCGLTLSLSISFSIFGLTIIVVLQGHRYSLSICAKHFKKIKLDIYWILIFNLLTAKTIKAILMFTHAMFAFLRKKKLS